jgi:hypothetical protein
MTNKFDNVQCCTTCGRKFKPKELKGCYLVQLGLVIDSELGKETANSWFCSEECKVQFYEDLDEVVKKLAEKEE